MNQPPFDDAEAVRQQLLRHLRHLRSAGVDWLPQGLPFQVATPAALQSKPETFDLGSVEASVANDVTVLSLEERRLALTTLADEVKTCTRCTELCSSRTQTVFGQGNLDVELCFVGEAPGADEDAQGIPFVGAAGQLFDRIIAASGLQRDAVYICNILKCRPPGNRTPLASEANNCRDYLDRQLALVQPKYIVALGGCAATHLLQTTLSIGKLRGRFHDYHGVPVMVTYHPAFLLPHRSPEKKREVWEDMKMLLQKMGRPVPG